MEQGIKELLVSELQDIYSAEQQIVKAMPDMITASQSKDLKSALENHWKETKGQIDRLEKIFTMLNIQRKEKFCKGAQGLIEEAKEVLTDMPNSSPMRDAAIISKAQRIEHYEISAYGTARSYADELDLSDVEDLLDDTLEEESNADETLTKLAEGGIFKSGINVEANKQM